MSDLITFEAIFIKSSELSLTVKVEDQYVVLPKSQIKYDEDELENIQKDNTFSVEIPEWLATDRQLI